MFRLVRLVVRLCIGSVRFAARAVGFCGRWLFRVVKRLRGRAGFSRKSRPSIWLYGAAAEAYLMTWRMVALYIAVFCPLGTVCVVVYSVTWCKWWLLGYAICLLLVLTPWVHLFDSGLLVPTYEERVYACPSGSPTTCG